MVLSAEWCLLTAGWLLYWVMGLRYLEYIPVSEQKIHWIIRILNNRTKGMIQTKVLNKQKSNNNKLATNNTGTEWFECLKKGWIVTFQYLLGFNIFVITNRQLQPCFASVLVHEASLVISRAAEFYFLPAGSLMALWRIIESLSTPCVLMPNL